MFISFDISLAGWIISNKLFTMIRNFIIVLKHNSKHNSAVCVNILTPLSESSLPKIMKMFLASVLFFTVFFKVSIVSADSDCLFPCTFHHDPLCGFDGETYKYFGNDCFMERYNHCNTKSKFEIFYWLQKCSHNCYLYRFHKIRWNKLQWVQWQRIFFKT